MSMQLIFETSGERGDVYSSAVSFGSITDSSDSSGKSMKSAMKRGARAPCTSEHRVTGVARQLRRIYSKPCVSLAACMQIAMTASERSLCFHETCKSRNGASEVKSSLWMLLHANMTFLQGEGVTFAGAPRRGRCESQLGCP